MASSMNMIEFVSGLDKPLANNLTQQIRKEKKVEGQLDKLLYFYADRLRFHSSEREIGVLPKKRYELEEVKNNFEDYISFLIDDIEN
jgi:hypothetical protein